MKKSKEEATRTKLLPPPLVLPRGRGSAPSSRPWRSSPSSLLLLLLLLLPPEEEEREQRGRGAWSESALGRQRHQGTTTTEKHLQLLLGPRASSWSWTPRVLQRKSTCLAVERASGGSCASSLPPLPRKEEERLSFSRRRYPPLADSSPRLSIALLRLPPPTGSLRASSLST